MIAIGDLYQRHANLVEDHIKKLYTVLNEAGNIDVRYQCLLVIVHLILNGMLKLKGEIVDILMLLLDEDESIKNQVKLFLSELNVKDNNIIYNLF